MSIGRESELMKFVFSGLTLGGFEAKRRGLKQEGRKQGGSTQTGSLHAGSMHGGWMQYEEFVQAGPLLDVRRVGFDKHLSDKSKSDNIMWPSSLTKTFSGFKSLYTTPIIWRYSSARSTCDA